MKRLDIFAALSVLAVFFLFSCGSDNDKPTPPNPKPDEPTEEVTAITVETESGKIEIKKGETLAFVVKDQNGKAVTKDVEFYVDNKKIEGNSFKFEKAKYFFIYAKYKDLKSPKLKITVKLSPITIEIKEGKTEVELGTTLSFVVKNEKGEELKNDVIIYVDKKKIEGFSHKFNKLGKHTVQAKYDGARSQELTITVTAPPTTHTAKVLLEDFTGTWCGYCPRVAGLIEDLKEEDPKRFIPIAYHAGNSGQQKDPFHYSKVGSLMNAFGIQGFPYLLVDRAKNTEAPEEIKELFNKFAYLGLAISSKLTGEQLDVKVKVHYEYAANGTNKLVVFLLEDGLKANQANYYNNDSSSRYYQKGNPIKGFVHNHVARVELTNVLGDDIPADKTVKDAMYEKDFQITLPESIKDKSKLTLVAFVVNSKRESINAQSAKVGEDKDFD